MIHAAFVFCIIIFLNFSPRSIAGKKSNELLQSGLNSLKSFSTGVVKKLDEMKEVISANSTPVKGAVANATSALTSLITEEDSTDGSSEINPDGASGSFSIMTFDSLIPNLSFNYIN